MKKYKFRQNKLASVVNILVARVESTRICSAVPATNLQHRTINDFINGLPKCKTF